MILLVVSLGSLSWLCLLTFLGLWSRLLRRLILRLGTCCTLLLLFLLILLLLKLHRRLFRSFLKFLLLRICIIIKLSFFFWGTFLIFLVFSLWGSLSWRRRGLLFFDFWCLLRGRLLSFLVWRLSRFFLLFRLLLLLFTGFIFLLIFSWLFRLRVLIASNKFTSEPNKEIVDIKPFGALLGLCKHLIRRIRHLRSNICPFVVANSMSFATLRELDLRVHIHLIIKRLPRR